MQIQIKARFRMIEQEEKELTTSKQVGMRLFVCPRFSIHSFRFQNSIINLGRQKEEQERTVAEKPTATHGNGNWNLRK